MQEGESKWKSGNLSFAQIQAINDAAAEDPMPRVQAWKNCFAA